MYFKSWHTSLYESSISYPNITAVDDGKEGSEMFVFNLKLIISSIK